jgi:hypothetical protein
MEIKMPRNEQKTQLLTIVCLLSVAIAASADPRGGPPSISLDTLKAGVDYPTDAPIPKQLANTSALVLDKNTRILVGKQSVLVAPTAGIDYPTSSPIPDRLKSATIIVLDGKQRVAVKLEPARAGIDYPTDAPAPSRLVWVFGNSVRMPLPSIAKLERAVAGIDFRPMDRRRSTARSMSS